MNPVEEHVLNTTRRHFFSQSASGLGAAALATLMSTDKTEAATGHRGLPGLPHFESKAKRAIYLFMAGGPSQLDTFDYKPQLKQHFNADLRKMESVTMGQRITTMTSGQKTLPIAPSKYKFQQHGKSGAWISELLPYHAKMSDDLAIIKTVNTEAINHDPAITYICTGHQLPGRASLGSWLSYGLGSANENLPSFVVMTPSWTGRKQAQALFNRLWGSGFLPSEHQGVSLRSSGDPVLFLSNPPGISSAMRRRMLDRLERFNQRTLDRFADPETKTRMEQYEMAFKMQSSVPELADFSGETKETFKSYGPDVNKPGTFAASCLLARRMAERGVQFVQIFHRGWDQHGNVGGDLPNQCRDIDQPCWALIQDLKQRGLLEDTLVVWGGEFGRTVYCQGTLTKENYGRDHHPRNFPVWMSGGGIKPGQIYGETDEFSYNVVENPVHINDLNATILNRLGIDHKRLTFKFQGLDMRLTGVLDHAPVEALFL